jgi:hypothetical protein
MAMARWDPFRVLMTIQVPKAEAAKSKKIQVKASA